MFLFLVGCKEKSEETNQEEQSIQFVPTLLSFQSCFTTQENEVSFPAWFNDSIILERKIARIHREYVVPDADSGEVYTRMLKIYDFDKKGDILQAFRWKDLNEIAVHDVTFPTDQRVIDLLKEKWPKNL
jgi:hypothetical protein